MGMIDNELWIDDVYIKKAYPLPYTFDNDTLYPLVNMAQVTKAQDIIGSCMYERIVDGVANMNLTVDEASLFNLLQYYVAFSAIRSAANLMSGELGDTSSSKVNLSNPELINSLKKELKENITYMEGKILDLILNTNSLLSTATGGECADAGSVVSKRFKDLLNDTYNSPMYFRPYSADKGCN